MQTVKVKGTATYSDNGFHFTPNPQRDNAAPAIETLRTGRDWRLRKSSQNYLLSFKLPLELNRQEMEDRILAALPVILSDIVVDKFDTGDYLGW